MNKKEALRQKIENNKRYLVHANAVLTDAKMLLRDMDLPPREKQPMRGLRGEVGGQVPTEGIKKLGTYKNHLNGKGWRKLRI
jgi:hypothetical protein